MLIRIMNDANCNNNRPKWERGKRGAEMSRFIRPQLINVSLRNISGLLITDAGSVIC